MIVVDVGCSERGREESVHRLIERFHPELLIGFDPDPELVEGVEEHDGTVIVKYRRVGWVDAEPQPVEFDGICTGIDYRADRVTELVPAVDVPALVELLPGSPILKLDCEGAELELLGAIRELELDLKLGLILVEWHPVEVGTDHGRGRTRDEIRAFAATLRCPVEEWAFNRRPVLT